MKNFGRGHRHDQDKDKGGKSKHIDENKEALVTDDTFGAGVALDAAVSDISDISDIPVISANDEDDMLSRAHPQGYSSDHGNGFVQLDGLQKYIAGLDEHAVYTDGVVDNREELSSVFHDRIEEFTDVISKELYKTLDTRTLASGTQEEVDRDVTDFVSAFSQQKELKLSPKEMAAVIQNIENDILGLGPIEELLKNDDISDIMVDGPESVYVEIGGKIEKTDIHFRSNDHLENVCRRIVSRVGRRVDAASPICDARLIDGSRVNVILPPLALNGATLTIRKFKKDRITLDKLVDLGSIDKKTAALLQIIAASRVNILVSGATGGGKTTLLNCLTRYISPTERIITCEDAAELQLQQQKVVRLETRPTSTEGVGLVTMRDLVKNCLRMRPDRIIVGEVRGPEAFDLLQAMNTGHDGSMGTLHANTPRDALFRLENMVAMANLHIPTSVVREQIASSLEIIVHINRLKDGSRKVINITEIVGMSDGMITLQDLMHYEMIGEDHHGNIIGKAHFTHLKPKFYQKAAHYGLGDDLLKIVED